MKFEIGKKYLLKIQAGRMTLTFTGVITSVENGFVSFIDKFDKELCYNLNNVISFEEVENGG